MIQSTRRFFLFAAAMLFVALPARAEFAQFTKGVITIDTHGGKQIFNVEIAKDEAQRAQGLMYRRTMAADAGMLFLYETEQPVSFWMKNTVIPLDMLFIKADGHIVSLHERAVPMDETPIPSDEPALAVVELNGGTVDRLGIKVGDVVHGPGLGGS